MAAPVLMKQIYILTNSIIKTVRIVSTLLTTTIFFLPQSQQINLSFGFSEAIRGTVTAQAEPASLLITQIGHNYVFYDTP